MVISFLHFTWAPSTHNAFEIVVNSLKDGPRFFVSHEQGVFSTFSHNDP